MYDENLNGKTGGISVTSYKHHAPDGTNIHNGECRDILSQHPRDQDVKLVL